MGASNFDHQYILQMHRENQSHDNLATSPLSVRLAFGQVSLGAKNKTAEELTKVFGPMTLSDWENLNQAFQSKSVDILLGNNFWSQKGMQLDAQFVTNAQKVFSATPGVVDFKNTEPTRKLINQWISDKTKKLIPEALKPSDLSASSKMVLVNTVYFKGKWKHIFNKLRTEPFMFNNSDGTKNTHLMMSEKRNVQYFENSKLEMISLPFADENYEMRLIKPLGKNLKISESDVKSALDVAFQEIFEREVVIRIPVFEMRFRKTLNATMQKMGLESIFDPQRADLTGIAQKGQLYIDQVVHETVVKVNEEGAEAAAMTAMVARAGAAKGASEKKFILDRPFIFFITEKTKKQILFFGETNKLN